MKIVNFNLQLFAMDPGNIEALDEETTERVNDLKDDYELEDILSAFQIANTTDANRTERTTTPELMCTSSGGSAWRLSGTRTAKFSLSRIPKEQLSRRWQPMTQAARWSWRQTLSKATTLYSP